MKLKQACYDPAFSRMGFKRFAPVGILYTLILVILTLANVNMGQNMHANAVMGLLYFFQITVLLQFGYAFVLVQLLLGDLYIPRLCFAIHSLPVTRGGWFGTQVIQGILSVIPGILLSGGMMAASVTRFRFLIPLWMGVAMLQFLFFFGLALLCGVGAGNRLGMAVLYGMANFFGVIITWARLKIFAPLTYGMYIPDTEVMLCPISKFLHAEVFRSEYQSFYVREMEDGPTAFFNSSEITKVELVPEGIRINLILAALGILAIFLAMKLLNRRKPECAGDLLAFRVTEPVILVLCTLSAGVVFHAVSNLFDWSIGYVMLFLGLALGYYICLMLLKRQVNVFTGKSLLPLAAMVCLTVLALGITGLDLFGTTYKLPEAEDVQQVELRVPLVGYHDSFTAETPEDIQKVLTLHQDMLEEHRREEAQRPILERIFGNEEAYQEHLKEDGTAELSGQMFLTYTMQDGSTLCRSYQFHETIPNLAILQDIYSQPEYVFSDFGLEIFSEQDVRALLEKTEFIQLTCWHDQEQRGYYQDKTLRIPKEDWNSLLEAMLEDGKNGNMAQNAVLHPNCNYLDYISLYYPASYFEGLDTHSINVYSDSTNTLNWLIDHGYHDELKE